MHRLSPQRPGDRAPRSRASASVYALLVALAASAGCSGEISGVGGTPSDTPPRRPGEPAPDAPLDLPTVDDFERYSRLTKLEYRFVIHDLLEGADGTLRSAALTQVDELPENNYAGFYQNHSFINASPRLASLQLQLARTLARAFLTSSLYGELCGGNNPDCVDNVLDRLLPRLWKRPIAPSEREELVAFLDETPAESRAYLFFLRVFASPYFHFKIFDHEPASPRDRAIKHANLLSFSLMGTFPDETLQQAIEAGALDDAPNWEPHVRRMLTAHPERFALLFLPQWLGMSTLYESGDHYRDVPMTSVMAEPAFLFAALIEEGETVAPLISIDFTMNDRRLAELYGAETDDSWEGWMRRDADHTIFGSAAMSALFVYDSGNPNPIRRGSYIVNRLLCRNIIFPSESVQTEVDRVVDSAPEGLSPPARMAYFRSFETCATCHDQFDHHGLALEQIGALGETRTTYYTGDPVEPSGVAEDIVYESSRDYARQLAETSELHTCFAAQLQSYFSGGNHLRANSHLRRIAGDLHNKSIADVVVQMANFSLNHTQDDR